MWVNNGVEFEIWTVSNVTIDLALLSQITFPDNNAIMWYAINQGKKYQYSWIGQVRWYEEILSTT